MSPGRWQATLQQEGERARTEFNPELNVLYSAKFLRRIIFAVFSDSS